MSSHNGRYASLAITASSWHWRRAGLEQGKIARTRRWRVTNYDSNIMGTTVYLREHHFLNVYSGLAD